MAGIAKKINFTVAFKTADGAYPQHTIVLKRNRPACCKINRKAPEIEIPANGAFYAVHSKGVNPARPNQRFTPLPGGLEQAFQAYRKLEADHLRRIAGVALASEFAANKPAAMPGRTTIADAVTAYKTDMERRKALWFAGSSERDKLAPASVSAYIRAIEDFRDNCGVAYMDEITRTVLLIHKTWLYANLDKRNGKSGSRTVANRFQNLKSFFHANSVEICRKRASLPNDTKDFGLMLWAEYPRKVKKEAKKAEMYSDAEISSMMAHASIDDGDLIQMFLQSGLRDGEVQHMTWNCIDFEDDLIHVKDKPQYGWRIKDCETRSVPLERGLGKRLQARQKRQTPKCELVFPTQDGNPNNHLIKRLHKVVKKAKAAGCTFKGAIELHKFRKTYATNLWRAGLDQETLRGYTGHSDLVTLQGYLVTENAAGPDVINRVAARQREAAKAIGA